MPASLPDKLSGLPPSGDVVGLDSGPTFVAAIGTGPPVLVLHGGPGFDHRYLVGPLSTLTDRRTLVFFDQPGSGRTPAPEPGVVAETIFDHFGGVAAELFGGREVGVIAHSWGSLVLLGACARTPRARLPCFTEGAIVNPVPPTRKAYDDALARLLQREPAAAAEFFRAIQAGEDGSEAMKAVLPYYSPRGFAEPVDRFPLAADTFLSVSRQLSDFDYSGDLSCLRRLTVVCGLDDFVSADLIAPLLEAAERSHLLADTGHFPFFEDPAAFAGLLGSIFPAAD